MDTDGLDREPADDDRSAALFFAELSQDLMQEPSEQPTVDRIAQQAVETIPACDHCGISIRRKERFETAAATSPVADECDALQYELEEGPCVEAIWDAESYLANDTRHETRWPRWSPQVADRGIRSVLSIRLSTASKTLGAMNLYAHHPHAFTDDDIDLAVIFGAHAANALNAARLVSGLEEAVHSRHLIGVAQGVLMVRYNLGLDQAFEVLRRYSNHRNVKLRDLATAVVEHRRLPGEPPPA